MVSTKLSLSLNEPVVRTVYAKEGDSGRTFNLDIDPTPSEDGTLRIKRPDGVEVTSSASSGGSSVGDSFSTIADGEFTKLEMGIEPVQDLHGQSSPYPSGGGVNKYPNCAISGASDGVTITHNSTEESYKISGLSTAYRGFVATDSFTLKAGTYKITRTASSSSVSETNLRMEIRSTDGLTTYGKTDINGGVFTLASDTEVKARIVVGQSNVDFGTGITCRFQIEVGSTPTTWSPYSNICPISGSTEANLTRTGKNLVKPIGTSESVNGINYTENEDGSVTLANTSTAISIHKHGQAYLKAGVTYALSGGITNVQLSIRNQSGSVSYAYTESNTTYTPTTDLEVGIFVRVASGKTVNATVYPQVELGSTATTYEPYQGSTYTTSLGQTVYGGTLDVVSGKLTVTHGNIASYNGETLPSTWISDRDVYASGTTPTIGAQVVYELATPLEYDLTPQQISTLLGENNIFSDSGDVVDVAFTYDGMYAELPSSATSVVGRCIGDVELNGVSTMPFTLVVQKNNQGVTP